MREELEAKIKQFCKVNGLPWTPHGLFLDWRKEGDWCIVFKGERFVRLPCEDVEGFLNEIVEGSLETLDVVSEKHAVEFNLAHEAEKAKKELEKAEVKDEVKIKKGVEEPKKERKVVLKKKK